MSLVQQNEIQMLNEYISALERQIKSNQGQRQNLLQQVAKAQQNSSKSEIQLRQVKNQLKELSSVMTRQGVQKTNIDARVKMMNDQNQRLRKQGDIKEQKITQLTNTIREKNEQIAKQKNTTLMSSNYHTKQLGTMQQKSKQLQQSLSQSLQEKNLLNYNIQSLTQQLTQQRQQNEKLKTKNNFCENYIQSLQGKQKLSQKQILQLIEQKQRIIDQRQRVTRSLYAANQEITKGRKQCEELQMRLVRGSQSSQQAKGSYQIFIKGLKGKHTQEIQLLNNDINRLRQQGQQLRNNIQSLHQQLSQLDTLLTQTKSTLEKQKQLNTQLTQQLNSLSKQYQTTSKRNQEQLISNQQLISTLQRQSEQWMTKWKRTQQELQAVIAMKYSNQQQYKFNLHESEIKYHQQLRQKQDKIDTMGNEINVQSLQIQQLKYHMNQSKKREQRLIQQNKKKQSQIETLSITLQMKRQKIQELSNEMSQTYQLLQQRTKQSQQKGRQGEQLNQKQSQILTQIDNLKKQIVLLTKLKEQKNIQNKRYKSKIQQLSEQLSQLKKIQTKLLAKVQQQQQKLTRTLQDFTNTKQGSEQKLAQRMKRVGELQRQLDRIKKQLKQKEQLLKLLTVEYQLKVRQFATRQQQLLKKISQQQNKANKQQQKITELQRQTQKRQSDFNKALQKLIQQHSLQQQQTAHKHEQQIKQIQTKYFQQTNILTNELQQKMEQISQLQNQLTKHQFNTVQYSSNQSSMQKTIVMLQKQLQQAHLEINAYHQKLFSFNLNNDKTKQLLLEKDIKTISLTALLQKAKKDNERLLNQQIMLREQVAALQTSTTYLKRQLTSTLQRQQTSLKQIRSLQQANKSYSKLINSTSSTNLFNPNNNSLSQLNSSRTMDKHKSVVFNMTRGLSNNTESSGGKNTGHNDSIVEEVTVETVSSTQQRRRENYANNVNVNRVLHKYSKPQSTTSIDSPNAKNSTTIKQQEVSFAKDAIQMSEFVTTSVNNSRSSTGGNTNK